MKMKISKKYLCGLILFNVSNRQHTSTDVIQKRISNKEKISLNLYRFTRVKISDQMRE